MKYVIGSVVIVAFAAGAYATFRLLAFKEMLDAFGRDIRGDEEGEKATPTNGQPRAS